MSDKLNKLYFDLYSINALKFGNFLTKSGITTPIYMDLRVLVSHPKVLRDISSLIWNLINEKDLKYDRICGVPYTALPIATAICLNNEIPMVMCRKEAKNYGTKKMIEGNFQSGQTCIIIEDVITSGTSIMETVKHLTEAGLKVTDAIVVIDREQGGCQNLLQKGINVHSLCPLSETILFLQRQGLINSSLKEEIDTYLSQHRQTKLVTDFHPKILSLQEKKEYAKHPLAKQLLDIIEIKKSNLCVSLDVSSCEKLLEMASMIGPYVCMVKVHADILEDFSPLFGEKLKNLAEKHNFLIFEDRKFGDIGSIMQKQCTGGYLKILSWAHLITVHSLPGPGILKALKDSFQGAPDKACILVAEMSSEGSLTSKEYVKETVAMAESYPDVVIGFVCQSQISQNSGFLQFIPGVNIESAGDSLGQKYVSPQEAIVNRKADVIIVGRGITSYQDYVTKTKEYQKLCFQTFLDNLN